MGTDLIDDLTVKITADQSAFNNAMNQVVARGNAAGKETSEKFLTGMRGLATGLAAVNIGTSAIQAGMALVNGEADKFLNAIYKLPFGMGEFIKSVREAGVEFARMFSDADEILAKMRTRARAEADSDLRMAKGLKKLMEEDAAGKALKAGRQEQLSAMAGSKDFETQRRAAEIGGREKVSELSEARDRNLSEMRRMGASDAMLKDASDKWKRAIDTQRAASVNAIEKIEQARAEADAEREKKNKERIANEKKYTEDWLKWEKAERDKHNKALATAQQRTLEIEQSNIVKGLALAGGDAAAQAKEIEFKTAAAMKAATSQRERDALLQQGALDLRGLSANVKAPTFGMAASAGTMAYGAMSAEHAGGQKTMERIARQSLEALQIIARSLIGGLQPVAQ